MTSSIDVAKYKAAEESLRKILNLRPRILGVGTGSTVDIFLDLLVKRRELVDAKFVCASLYTAQRLAESGFNVMQLSTVGEVDVYVDGADEVDRELNMIKGGGGASTLEKIIAYASNYRIYMVDYTKLVNRLGEKHAIPVEVLPEALNIVYKRLREMGFEATIRFAKSGKYGYVVSDTRGVIIDVRPSQEFNARELAQTLKSIPGVVETGLFVDMADEVIVGYPDRVEVLRKNRI
ncbi:MAG: ribose-5-phosphate isomerase RpiA [Ignisphaera sp.]